MIAAILKDLNQLFNRKNTQNSLLNSLGGLNANKKKYILFMVNNKLRGCIFVFKNLIFINKI